MISAALLFSSNTAAYSLGASRPVVSARGSAVMAETEKADGWKAAGLAAALALATGVQSASAGPFTRTEIASLTYEQIKGTGLANTCPTVEGGSSGTSIKLNGKTRESTNMANFQLCRQHTFARASLSVGTVHDAFSRTLHSTWW